MVEVRITQTHVSPVIGELLDALHGDTGISGVALECCHNGVHGGLRGQAGHGCNCGIHNVHAGFCGHQQGCDLVAGGIVGVEMNRNADLLLQGVYQFLGRIGLEQAGHILDADGVGADVLQLLGQLYIVVQGIAGTGLVHNVAGVADGCLAELILLQDLIHGDGHAGHPVQGIEYAEDINAAQCRLLDKFAHNIIGIVLIAHGVGAAEQHLERNIGDLFPEQIQPLPGIFMQKPVSNIEGCAAPHFQREAIRQNICGAVCALDHIAGTHSGGQQGLMGIAHGGIGNQQLLLIHHPLGQRLGSLCIQQLLEAVLGMTGALGKSGGIVLLPLSVGICHLNVGDVLEHAGCTILGIGDIEQLGRFVNKLGMALARHKGRMAQNIGNKGNIGLYAAHPNLADGAKSLPAGALEGVIPAGDLNQQRIIVRGNHGAGGGITAIETHAVAAAGAIGGNLTVIGSEVIGGIFGGNTALNGIAAHLNIVLRVQTNGRVAQRIALGDQDLSAHQVDAGDHLGHGVLNLNTGVHLDEVVAAGLVHQELQRTGIDVAHGLCNLDCIVADLLGNGRVNRPCRCKLYYLLVAALEGAVALADMIAVAILIGQHLHLNVLGLY